MDNPKQPTEVIALAKKIGASAIAWRKTPTGWVIVFNDGRKLAFSRDAVDTQKRNKK